MTAPWYANPGNLATLLEWLHANGHDFAQCMYALRNPWKYEKEWAQALEAAK